MNLRTAIVEAFWPLVLWIGQLHWPFSRRKLTQLSVDRMRQVLQPGDLILTRIHGEPSNILLGDSWTHVMVVVNDSAVVEAVWPKVKMTPIYDAVMTKDEAMVVRARHSDHLQRFTAAEWAMTTVGTPYDHRFDLTGPSAVYCAELAYWAHKRANPSLPFEPRPRFGQLTIHPRDFARAEAAWAAVWTK